MSVVHALESRLRSTLWNPVYSVVKKLFEEKIIRRYETKRLTKNGKVLDVIMRGAILSGNGGEPGGELIILRDITKEKILSRTNEALLRISRALPEYPDLEGLLDYISREVKRLLNVEGALVVLHDEVKQELADLLDVEVRGVGRPKRKRGVED